MSVFVLRLRSAELAEGRLVGEVENVASGGTALIHSIEELIGFVTGHTGERHPPPRPVPGGR